MYDIKKKIASGEDVDEPIGNGNPQGREWLKGRRRKSTDLATTSVPAEEIFLDDLTKKIKRELEVEFEAKVNKKVQDNISMLLKKIGEVNTGLNLDIGEFCATL